MPRGVEHDKNDLRKQKTGIKLTRYFRNSFWEVVVIQQQKFTAGFGCAVNPDLDVNGLILKMV